MDKPPSNSESRPPSTGRAASVQSDRIVQLERTVADQKAELDRIAADKAYLFRANVANEWEDRYAIQANKIEELEAEVARLRDALRTLSGCLPDPIFVYGCYGERWSNMEPDEEGEYETVDFKELLAESNTTARPQASNPAPLADGGSLKKEMP